MGYVNSSQLFVVDGTDLVLFVPCGPSSSRFSACVLLSQNFRYPFEYALIVRLLPTENTPHPAHAVLVVQKTSVPSGVPGTPVLWASKPVFTQLPAHT